MEKYFYQSLGRGISNLFYHKFGEVKIAIFTDKEGKFVRTVSYNAPSSVINDLTDKEKEARIVFSKDYNIEDMKFSEEVTVYKKLNEIISDIEKTLFEN